MWFFKRNKLCLNLPKYHFDYYYPDKKYVDLEKLIKGVQILSQGQIEINTHLQNLSAVEFKDGKGSLGSYYLKNMDEANVGIVINRNMTLEELILKINQVIQTKKYDISLLSVESIKLKARTNKIKEYIHVISEILKDDDFVLIQALEVCGYFITVVTVKEKVELDILEAK